MQVQVNYALIAKAAKSVCRTLTGSTSSAAGSKPTGLEGSRCMYQQAQQRAEAGENGQELVQEHINRCNKLHDAHTRLCTQ
jgi:hypothetical protein